MFIQQRVGYRYAIKILMVVFGKSQQGVWWSMLSKDDDLGDIKAEMRISFDLLLHLFLRTKIIKYTVNFVVNWYTVSITSLTELANSVT